MLNKKEPNNENDSSRIVSHAFTNVFPKILAHPFLHNKNIRLNSDGYRSDEFTKTHEGLHILFSGCSNTYGDGLEEHEIWAKQLYDKIKMKENLSGFFNIATPGQGITYIVFHIFKYIDNFGKPDVIFINLPVPRRFVSHDNENNRYVYTNYFEPTEDNLSLWFTIPFIEYQYLYMLEQYCKSLGTTLIYGTWDQKSYLYHTYKSLDSFIDINDEAKIAQYAIDHSEDKYTLNARDNIHYGTAFHNVWAEAMYNRYMETKRL